MVDMGSSSSQNWYRDFFRLAGFHRCRCQCLALQVESRNCLSLRKSVRRESPTIYKKMDSWLAEDRCTESSLDAVATCQATQMERECFHDALKGLGKERRSGGKSVRTEPMNGDPMGGQSRTQESVRRSTGSKGASKPRTGAVSLRTQWSKKSEVVKSIGMPGSRVTKHRIRVGKSGKEGL